MSADAAWYAVRVSPLIRSTERVEQFMTKRLGFTFWWPKLVEIRKRPRRGVTLGARGGRRWTNETVQRPLWPRYILVALPIDRTPFSRLNNEEAKAFGLHGVLGTVDGPTVIPNEIVAELQRREAAGEWDRTARVGRRVVERPPDWATIGSRVELTDGPFASFHAIVEELTGDRARVAVSIFGRSTPVDTHLSQLRPSR